VSNKLSPCTAFICVRAPTEGDKSIETTLEALRRIRVTAKVAGWVNRHTLLVR